MIVLLTENYLQIYLTNINHFNNLEDLEFLRVLAGFKNAKGDAIIYMDSDLQDPPELIKDLIDKHEQILFIL